MASLAPAIGFKISFPLQAIAFAVKCKLCSPLTLIMVCTQISYFHDLEAAGDDADLPKNIVIINNKTAPLKLRPYGAIQICLLLLFF